MATNRIASGESYVAGGTALNALLAGRRLSRDIDVFHDSADAVAASWESDRRLLTDAGLAVSLLRERPSFVEAEVTDGRDAVRLDWVRDSAFRFSPSWNTLSWVWHCIRSTWPRTRCWRSSDARSRATGLTPSTARNTCSRSAIWHGRPAARIPASALSPSSSGRRGPRTTRTRRSPRLRSTGLLRRPPICPAAGSLFLPQPNRSSASCRLRLPGRVCCRTRASFSSARPKRRRRRMRRAA